MQVLLDPLQSAVAVAVVRAALVVRIATVQMQHQIKLAVAEKLFGEFQ